jgi:hypothetical protein
MRSRLFLLNFLIVLLLQTSTQPVTALSELDPILVEASSTSKTVSLTPELTVKLDTPTGKTIVFKAEEGEPAENEIPHLVLTRNGVPTPGFERTLQVSVGNLPILPSGIYVQLVVETQHGDPDFDRRRNVRIRVWKESRFIAFDQLTKEGLRVLFRVDFDPETVLSNQTIKTPTDYYRCRIVITDAQGKQLRTYVRDFAFLLESQWRVPLPDVLEATPGAAPDELLVYYYDMMLFQSNLRDPDTRIPRQEVDRYVQTELIPAMVEAFRIQSDLWGFPWYEEWRNYRREEPPKTLSVALGEHSLWFHGKPASLGHSMISIRVDGTTGEYDSLTDGIMSIFHHELFHNHQRNMSLHYSKLATVAGKDEAWMMFSEGTAVLASSVGQPAVQFAATAQPRSYMKRANAFLGSEISMSSGLNKSYKDIPYHTALYWRFLYEHCGGITPRGEDPAAGMQVIRHILETLYQGEVVDINSSTDVARAFPRILDAALATTASCEFRTYEDSLIHFARAVYMLRFENGRCGDRVDESRCGFKDPAYAYATPRAETYLIGEKSSLHISDAIPSSFGIDFQELTLGSSFDGKTLKIVFVSNTHSNVSFHVEIWKTRAVDESNGTQQQLAQMIEPIASSTQNGSLTLEFENIESSDFDGLGLIITRTDPYEETETTGAYSIRLLAE